MIHVSELEKLNEIAARHIDLTKTIERLRDKDAKLYFCAVTDEAQVTIPMERGRSSTEDALLDALYRCDDELKAVREEAAKHGLSIGLQAVN